MFKGALWWEGHDMPRAWEKTSAAADRERTGCRGWGPVGRPTVPARPSYGNKKSLKDLVWEEGEADAPDQIYIFKSLFWLQCGYWVERGRSTVSLPSWRGYCRCTGKERLIAGIVYQWGYRCDDIWRTSQCDGDKPYLWVGEERHPGFFWVCTTGYVPFVFSTFPAVPPTLLLYNCLFNPFSGIWIFH